MSLYVGVFGGPVAAFSFILSRRHVGPEATAEVEQGLAFPCRFIEATPLFVSSYVLNASTF